METQTARKYDFETGIYRPPSEGGSYSLLLRTTRNCPWNRCTFCSMYKEEKFSLRTPEEIKQDIDAVASIWEDMKSFSLQLGYGGEINREVALALLQREPVFNSSPGFIMVFNWILSGAKTAFLQDANTMIMPTDQLVEVLTCLRRKFPTIQRVTTYARSKTIAKKKPESLKRIHEAGLDRLHVGLETGDDELLKKVKKGATGDDHIKGGRKAIEAGFQLSEYWMPGLGGKEMWEQHARNTARVMNAINPHYMRSRPFFPAPGTPVMDALERGEFHMLTPSEQLTELKLMISELNVTHRVCFDHAGNYWTNKRGALLFTHDYEGYKFPEEKEKVLALIQEGIKAHSSETDPGSVRPFLVR